LLTCHQQHVHLEANEISDEIRKPVKLASRPTVLDDQILALDITEFTQTLTEAIELTDWRGRGRHVAYPSDPRNLPRRLRLNGERRGEEAEGANDERPSLYHSITSSALCRSDGGIVRPRAFAVLRLITNSNFVGCSIGRSPGFAPLKILST